MVRHRLVVRIAFFVRWLPKPPLPPDFFFTPISVGDLTERVFVVAFRSRRYVPTDVGSCIYVFLAPLPGAPNTANEKKMLEENFRRDREG